MLSGFEPLDVIQSVRMIVQQIADGCSEVENRYTRVMPWNGNAKALEILEREATRGACEILGIDPLYIANEGKLLAVVPPTVAGGVLAAMRRHPLDEGACLIDEVWPEPKGLVFLQTEIGGNRVVDTLVGESLPRIC